VQDIYKKGSDRVIRGGSWYGLARLCRSANRNNNDPGNRNNNLGFRLANTQTAGAGSFKDDPGAPFVSRRPSRSGLFDGQTGEGRRGR
jgi:hypothetical protein